ncbi:MAG: 50S ribosomal protein L15 [Deltaproteobacteria bacterium]|nr:50S ribosomal protein L15 [Deltaproteobacteria bacterium]
MLDQLKTSPGATKEPLRKGRGQGSTLGKTAGRGQKGQYARNTVRRGFEGGQTPLHRRLPRRGFKNLFKTQFAIVNLNRIATCKKLDGVKEIDPQVLADAGLIRGTSLPVKVLGTGEIKRAIKLKAHHFSQASADKIKAAGGEALVIQGD